MISCLAVGWALTATTELSFAQASWGNWGSASYPTASAPGPGYVWGGGSGISSTGTGKDWKLGVTGDNTDVGVYVRQVEPNSSAARAGINMGDIIVCVANDQVGRVGSQVFDLAEELNHHANSNGGVRLLVQDGRSRQLRSLQVQLSDQLGGLTGTIVIPGGSLAPDSVVTVELENMTRPYFVVRNGRQSFRLPAYTQSNIPFALNYDPNYVAESDSYRVRATVTSAGRVTHTTAQPPFVLTRGYPNKVVLTLTPSAYVATTLPSNVVTVGYPSYSNGLQQVVEAYERYLGRRPTPVELAVWQQMTDTQYRLADLPVELMGSQEYYDRVGNNNVVWLERVFAEMLGRNPSATEMDQWMRRFGELRYSRTELLRQLKMVSGR